MLPATPVLLQRPPNPTKCAPQGKRAQAGPCGLRRTTDSFHPGVKKMPAKATLLILRAC